MIVPETRVVVKVVCRRKLSSLRWPYNRFCEKPFSKIMVRTVSRKN
jgi:hypothetical protein